MITFIKGISKYSIVIPKDCDECIRISAQSLKKYFNDCCGVELEISSKPNENFISIGFTKQLKLLNESFDEKELNADGFKILFRDKNIFLSGANDRATIYAVNEFIERFLKVRFLSYDDTFVPKSSEIIIPKKDVVEIPSFQSRCFFSANIKRQEEFASKMRFICQYANDVEAQKYGGGFLRDWNSYEMHSMHYFMPREKYYAKHPEWYAKDNFRGWLCLTDGLTDDDNDDGRDDSLLAVIAQNIIEEIKSHPIQKYFMLGHQDSNVYCQCERCKKSMERNVTASGYLMVWINAIARRVEKWRKENCPEREVYLVSFSYHETIIPPVYVFDGEKNQKPFIYYEREFWAPLKVREGEIVPVNKKVIPEKNVVVFCAPMATCYMHDMNDTNCDWNQYSGFSFKGWSALNAKFMVWYYGVNFWHYLWWLPNRKTMKGHLLFYKKYNPLFIMQQGAPNENGFYQSILNTYLLSKLMWNIELDTDELTKEFNDLYFGKEIAVYVNRFIEKIENHYSKLDEKYNGLYHSDIAENFKMSFNYENFPQEFLIECIEDLLVGLTVANDDDVKKKLKRVLIHPLYMLVYNFDKYKGINVKYVDMLEKYFDDLEIKFLSEHRKTPKEFIEGVRKKI